MEQQVYLLTLDELEIPISKIIEWTQMAHDHYYMQFDPKLRPHVDHMLRRAAELPVQLSNARLRQEHMERYMALYHDLGGPLNGILSDALIILAELVEGSTIWESIHRIESAAHFAYWLTRDGIRKIKQD